MKTLDLNQILNSHPYPGRGIVLGRSADDKKAVIVRTAATASSRPPRTASAPRPLTRAR